MRNKINRIFLFAILLAATLVSCQKELDGSLGGGGINPTPVNQVPRVGTTWTYRHYIYHQDGSLYQAHIMTLRIKSEEMLGGEKWFRVVNVTPDTTVFYLQVKPDGLYQYANNSPQLFLKDPALVGDNYNTFNEGFAEQFFVRGSKDTLPTGIGNVVVNYYEGYRVTNLIKNQIWYNKNAWIVRWEQFQNRALVGFFWYRYRAFYLDNIVY